MTFFDRVSILYKMLERIIYAINIHPQYDETLVYFFAGSGPPPIDYGRLFIIIILD